MNTKALLIITGFMTIFGLGFGCMALKIATNIKERSIEFAEWMRKNECESVTYLGLGAIKEPVWVTPYHGKDEQGFTSEELYNLFLKSRE